MVVCVLVAQSCLTLWDPMDCSGLGSSVYGILQYPLRILESLPDPGIKPRSPALWTSSPSEPRGKPTNTGVDSLLLLQGILLTQESNWGLIAGRFFTS